ncbi:hypothetical protein GF327_01580 [Candidatus Woesearchaeota archaeon]|nr:hypothetical protein [Candidatus Woesearchaeota archaeon]
MLTGNIKRKRKKMEKKLLIFMIFLLLYVSCQQKIVEKNSMSEKEKFERNALGDEIKNNQEQEKFFGNITRHYAYITEENSYSKYVYKKLDEEHFFKNQTIFVEYWLSPSIDENKLGAIGNLTCVERPPLNFAISNTKILYENKTGIKWTSEVRNSREIIRDANGEVIKIPFSHNAAGVYYKLPNKKGEYYFKEGKCYLEPHNLTFKILKSKIKINNSFPKKIQNKNVLIMETKNNQEKEKFLGNITRHYAYIGEENSRSKYFYFKLNEHSFYEQQAIQVEYWLNPSIDENKLGAIGNLTCIEKPPLNFEISNTKILYENKTEIKWTSEVRNSREIIRDANGEVIKIPFSHNAATVFYILPSITGESFFEESECYLEPHNLTFKILKSKIKINGTYPSGIKNILRTFSKSEVKRGGELDVIYDPRDYEFWSCEDFLPEGWSPKGGFGKNNKELRRIAFFRFLSNEPIKITLTAPNEPGTYLFNKGYCIFDSKENNPKDLFFGLEQKKIRVI